MVDEPRIGVLVNIYLHVLKKRNMIPLLQSPNSHITTHHNKLYKRMSFVDQETLMI